MTLHGPQGEVNGVLLENGTMLRFAPDQADQLGTVLQPRHPVVAEGVVVTNSLGTVVDVRRLGPSRDRLVNVGPRRAPPRSPEAPPPGALPPPPPPAG